VPDDAVSDNDELWQLFVAIHDAWGTSACRVEDMASQWRELIRVKSDNAPSYREEYRNAREFIADLRKTKGDQVFQYLLFDPDVQAESAANSSSHLSRLKINMIDEFIRVYVTAGGFVSGSRWENNAATGISITQRSAVGICLPRREQIVEVVFFWE